MGPAYETAENRSNRIASSRRVGVPKRLGSSHHLAAVDGADCVARDHEWHVVCGSEEKLCLDRSTG